MAEAPETAAPQQPQQPPRPKRKWLRRTIWLGAILIALLIALVLSLPTIARPIIRSKLQAMISENLNAQLRIGSMNYVYPYGVEVRDAALVAHDDDGSPVALLNIPELRISLARLPFKKGPLVIKEVVLVEPSVHLINTANGFIGQRTLARKDITSTEAQRRLSEMFELRLFSMTGAKIVYEDRTRPKTVPQVWRQIDVKLTTRPETNPIYAYDFIAGDGAIAELKAAGKFNIDDFTLDTHISSSLHVDPTQKESPAPPAVQEMLIDNAVSGLLSIGGDAHVSLKDFPAASYDMKFDLANGKARPAGWDQDLDGVAVRVRLSNAPLAPTQSPPASSRATYVRFEKLWARAGKNILKLDQAADASVDWTTLRWSLPDLRPHLRLATDKSSLPEQLRAAAEEAGIVGDIHFTIRGRGVLPRNLSEKPGYAVDIHAESPKLTITQRRLTLTNIKCDAALDPRLLRINAASADAYGGILKADGQLAIASPVSYRANAKVTGLDLAQFGRAWWRKTPKPPKLSGRGAAEVHVAGLIPLQGASPLDSLAGSGECEITGGEYYELPVLSDLTKLVSSKSKAGTVGQAAAVFTFAKRTVTVKKAAVSAPMLGVTGSGDITFDGMLDLKVTAAPLSDWKNELKKSGLPIISDIAGEVAGQAQKILNTATKKLIVAFKVSGTLEKPKITPQPAPALTQDVMGLFGDMLKDSQSLLKRMHEGE